MGHRTLLISFFIINNSFFFEWSFFHLDVKWLCSCVCVVDIGQFTKDSNQLFPSRCANNTLLHQCRWHLKKKTHTHFHLQLYCTPFERLKQIITYKKKATLPITIIRHTLSFTCLEFLNHLTYQWRYRTVDQLNWFDLISLAYIARILLASSAPCCILLLARLSALSQVLLCFILYCCLAHKIDIAKISGSTTALDRTGQDRTGQDRTALHRIALNGWMDGGMHACTNRTHQASLHHTRIVANTV